ncbi:MAG: FtsQ-type POTRA domain-containing protein [Oscillospiraceae bacterium]
MSQRKHQNKHKKGRFSVLYKVLSVVLIFAAIMVGSFVFFRVGQVEVIGNVRYTPEEVIAATGVKLGSNLFGVNKFTVATNLRSKLPYIEEVLPQRRLPDTLVITLRETVAAACVEGAGEWWVLDAGGKLLERRTTVPTEDYCVIRGITPLAPAEGTNLAASTEERVTLTALQGLMSALEKEGLLEKTDYIDLTQGYHIIFGYDDKYTVTLSSTADFPYRARFFREALESGRVVEGQKYTVDMTMDGQMRFIPVS